MENHLHQLLVSGSLLLTEAMTAVGRVKIQRIEREMKQPFITLWLIGFF
jgi:hypothetical protein